eukprot:CAMPEP_0206421632 /NCGR_PEP_ID=MMETSP0324_2-20121206/1561_1 /ASSEMBLY_ACC=CAM_ASM_000836 /TAXON_ID=2866 /ORGANISM="Crypthecodinium cohnii, Strain Seligo" /LENGTH=341 /DNA_ID=CAMNT_0053885759 /DNA_START=185 /DNA_END=1210 /DNA_ORIENTATION=-
MDLVLKMKERHLDQLGLGVGHTLRLEQAIAARNAKAALATAFERPQCEETAPRATASAKQDRCMEARAISPCTCELTPTMTMTAKVAELEALLRTKEAQHRAKEEEWSRRDVEQQNRISALEEEHSRIESDFRSQIGNLQDALERATQRIKDLEEQDSEHFVSEHDLLEDLRTMKVKNKELLGIAEFICAEALNMVSEFPTPALLEAAEHGEADALKQQPCKNSVMATDDEMMTLLHKAAMYGRLDVFKFLWMREVSGRRRVNEHGNMAIHLAILNGRLNIVQYIVKDGRGEFLEVRGQHNRTPLQMAVEAAQTEIAEYLVSMGADLRADSGDILLLPALV